MRGLSPHISVKTERPKSWDTPHITSYVRGKRGKNRLKIIFFCSTTLPQASQKNNPKKWSGAKMQIQGLLCKTAKSKSFCKAGTSFWRLSLLFSLCCFLFLGSSLLSLWSCFLLGSSFLSSLLCHSSMYQNIVEVHLQVVRLFIMLPSQYYLYIFSL